MAKKAGRVAKSETEMATLYRVVNTTLDARLAKNPLLLLS